MMSRYTKTGILLLMLVVPVFLFLYLRFFGENHYSLPRFYPVVDSVSGTVRLVSNEDRQWYEPKQDTVFHQVPPFSLLSQDSTLISDAQTRGRICVVGFFSTQSDALTRQRMAQLSRVQEVFYDRQDILILAFSLQPERDRPTNVRRFAAGFDPQPGKWLFLTGEADQLTRLRERGYKITHQAAQSTKTMQKGETIPAHEKLVLVDKAGVIRGYYNGGDKKDVDRLLLEIRVLLNIYQKEKS